MEERIALSIRKALIVAGGRGTRFLPATLAVPKELLPVVDTPMVHYVVAEAAAAGLHHLVLISAPGKNALEDYFNLRGRNLERALADRAADPKMRPVVELLNLLTVTTVLQQEPRGLGHAILTASEAVGDEPCAALLPDDIIDASRPAVGQMVEAYKKHPGCYVAVERIPKQSISAYGVVDAERVDTRLHRVHGLVEKPRPEDAPSDLGIVGRYILPPEIFDAIRRTPPGAKGEVQITDAIELLRREGSPVYAYEFEGTRYDTGTPIGHLKASIALALRRPDLGPALREYLSGLLAAPRV